MQRADAHRGRRDHGQDRGAVQAPRLHLPLQSEIYGGIGSTYDYGHYGVLLKTNVKNEWWRAMLAGARRHRRPRLGDPPAPARLGGLRATSPASPTRWSTAATCKQRFRADHLDRDEMCPAKASLPKTEDRRARPHRGARLQPDVRDARSGPVEGDGVGRLPAPRDRAGHLHQLQERPAVQPQEAAVRHRAGRQVVPQRDHAGQLHLPHARVRADGDGVLRPAGRGAAAGTSTGSRARFDWYVGARHPRPTTCACASTTPTSSATTRRAPPTSSTSSRSAGRELEGIANRGDFDLTQHAEYSGEKLEYFDQARRASATSRT